MEKNVGGIDRVARIVVGLALIVATIAGALPVWGWIGIVPLVTGLAGWCPAYRLLGFRTCGGGACCKHGDKPGTAGPTP